MKSKLLIISALLISAVGCSTTKQRPEALTPQTAAPVEAEAPLPKSPGLVFRAPGKVKIFSHTDANWNYADTPVGFSTGDRIRVPAETDFAELYIYKGIMLRLSPASTVGVISTAPVSLELINGSAVLWNNSGAELTLASESTVLTAGNGIFSARITGKNSLEILAYKGGATVRKNTVAQAVPEMKKLFLSAEGAFYLSPIARYSAMPPAPEPDKDIIREIDEFFAPKR